MFRSSSLALLIGAVLVAILTLFLGGIGILNYQYTKAEREAALQQEAMQLANRLQQSLVGPMWDFEQDKALEIIAGEMVSRNVAFIDCLEGKDPEGGKIFAAMTRNDAWEPVTAPPGWEPETTAIMESAPIVREGDVLGHVEVGLTERFLQEELATLATQTAIAVVGADLFIVLALFLVFRMVLIKPIKVLEQYAAKIGEGELECRIPEGDFRGEIAGLRDALVAMVCNLKDTIETVRIKESEARDLAASAERAKEEAEASRRRAEASRKEGMVDAARSLEAVVSRVTSISTELSSQVDMVKQGTDHQRASLSGATTAMNEMSATVLDVAQNAATTAELAESTKSYSQAGDDVVSNAVSSIGHVNERVSSLAANMTRLRDKADAIGRVITVIDDIADQTNLLALNAAIEAARAGEAGRGFAVVADEVRKLAEKTMTATREVTDSITAIQTEASTSADLTSEVSNAVEEASALSSESRASLSKILELAVDTADQIRLIATASEEQSSSTEEVQRTVEEIAQVADRTAAGMDEASAAIVQLASLNEELGALIATLKDAD